MRVENVDNVHSNGMLYDLRFVQAANLWKYPTVWLVCLCLFTIFGIICIINPYGKDVHTRSIIGMAPFVLHLSTPTMTNVL